MIDQQYEIQKEYFEIQFGHHKNYDLDSVSRLAGGGDRCLRGAAELSVSHVVVVHRLPEDGRAGLGHVPHQEVRAGGREDEQAVQGAPIGTKKWATVAVSKAEDGLQEMGVILASRFSTT